MPVAHYDASIAYDQKVKRGVPGQVARVFHPITDLPIDELLDLDGNPIAALVSNSQGFVEPFEIVDGPPHVKMSVGSLRYYIIDLNLVGSSAEAAILAAAAAERAANLVGAPADEVVKLLIEAESQSQGAGDARWLTNAGVDEKVSALLGDPYSSFQKAVDARYVKQDELPVSLKQFGAIGDGVADDSGAFLNFVIHLENTKSDGYIPNGKYRFGSPISLPADISGFAITGESESGVQFYFDPSSALGSYTVISCVDPSNITLKNFTLDCGLSRHAGRGHGISFRNPKNVNVSNARIQDHGYSAIMMFSNNDAIGQTANCTIKDVTADGYNNSDNGFLFVNAKSCYYINVQANNGGKNTWNTPSCGIQFKNKCVDCHAVNVTATGYKSGLTMGGDTAALGSENCTMQGQAYDCEYGVLIGKSTNNYVNASCARSTTRAVHFALDASANVVDVFLSGIPAGQTPISQGFHDNTVNVKYMPAGITKLVSISASVNNTKTIIWAHPGARVDPRALTDDLSGNATNLVATMDNLLELTSNTPTLRFNTSRQDWISLAITSNYMGFRLNGADRLVVRETSVSPGTNGTTSLGLASNAWTAVYLHQPNGTVRKVSVNDSGALIVE